MEWYEVAAVVISVMAVIGSFVNLRYQYVKRKKEANGDSRKALLSLFEFRWPERMADLEIDEDADEGRGDSPIAQFRIRYTDEHGKSTRRDITVHPFSSTQQKFSAYCHMRKATRTFLFHRVNQVIDLETGEVLPHADFFRRVHKRSRLP